MANKGFSLVEFISTCPVNWGMKPQDALEWAKENMIAWPYLKLISGRMNVMINEKILCWFWWSSVMLWGNYCLVPQ